MDFENNKRDGGADSAPVDGASGNRQMMGSYDLDEHVTIDFSDFFDDYDEEPAKKPGKIKNSEPLDCFCHKKRNITLLMTFLMTL